MLTELGGKSGCLCEPAKKGELRCPLIIRPTSEDVVTGNLFGTLKAINPRWWLKDLLNQALGEERFRRQVYRNLRIELWEKQRRYPRQHLKWNEGSTEVDVVITWENPKTTVFIEMKYGSKLSSITTHNNGSSGYPSDQLIRNARVGLRENGWFQEDVLFNGERRDFVLILLTPTTGNSLVQKYRDPSQLKSSIPDGKRLHDLPGLPFIGELGYLDVINILRQQRRWFSKPERTLIDDLDHYLEFKVSQLGRGNGQSH
ncbi:hypothetical protein [Rubinisphaera italica]|uniref:Uncharacterized protein n=1 Tax=Rubinisphaera italica TaxID=2527969 RepID=A0A5C5XCX1_9PLAN|nr:hypothetical protein [Rubinisphaera italica]TWT60830.1 hypothetical protein Pan54_15570 [Rubinisphaera italica]